MIGYAKSGKSSMNQESDKRSISVIIPVYNVETYIEQCLQTVISSVKSSSGNRVEVLVIDDGSTDSSGLIADEIAAAYEFVKVIHQPNAGVAAARNCGIREAQGRWLYFVDSDDWLPETAISDLCKRAEQYFDADVILFDAYRNIGQAEQPWEHFEEEMVWADEEAIRQFQAGVLYFPSMKVSTKIPLAAPWDKLFRYSFIEQHQVEFREELKVLDDMIFNYDVFGLARKVVYCKDKIYHYRHVPTSITNSYKPNRVSQDIGVWKYLEKSLEQAAEERRKQLEQAVYARIIKSFSICCRLCFFNVKNEKTLRQKLKNVRKVLGQAPYRKAFKEIEVSTLEWKLKIMAFMGKNRCAVGIYILYLAECLLQKLSR